MWGFSPAVVWINVQSVTRKKGINCVFLFFFHVHMLFFFFFRVKVEHKYSSLLPETLQMDWNQRSQQICDRRNEPYPGKITYWLSCFLWEKDYNWQTETRVQEFECMEVKEKQHTGKRRGNSIPWTMKTFAVVFSKHCTTTTPCTCVFLVQTANAHF